MAEASAWDPARAVAALDDATCRMILRRLIDLMYREAYEELYDRDRDVCGGDLVEGVGHLLETHDLAPPPWEPDPALLARVECRLAEVGGHQAACTLDLRPWLAWVEIGTLEELFSTLGGDPDPVLFSPGEMVASILAQVSRDHAGGTVRAFLAYLAGVAEFGPMGGGTYDLQIPVAPTVDYLRSHRFSVYRELVRDGFMPAVHQPHGGSHAPDCPYRARGECSCWRSDPAWNPDAGPMPAEDEEDDPDD